MARTRTHRNGAPSRPTPLKHHVGGDAESALAQRAGRFVQGAVENVETGMSRFGDAAVERAHKADQMIRRQPYVGIGVAFAAGALAVLMLRRHREN